VIPETSEEKIQTAMDHIGLRFGLAPEEYDSEIVNREDKKEAQRITGLLVKKLIAHSKYFDAKESGIKVFFPRSIERQRKKQRSSDSMNQVEGYLHPLSSDIMKRMDEFIQTDIHSRGNRR
jgi:hypothetical protein